jgi:hypothetical protein
MTAYNFATARVDESYLALHEQLGPLTTTYGIIKARE